MKGCVKVVLLGPYPPPSGGNSVHIERLQAALAKRHISCDVIDIYSTGHNLFSSWGTVYRVGKSRWRGLLIALALVRRIRPKVLHVHVSAFSQYVLAGPFIHWFCPRRTRKVLTIHSGGFVLEYPQFPLLKKFLVRRLLQDFEHLIAVSEEQAALLTDIAGENIAVSVLPAYLSPWVPSEINWIDIIISRLGSEGKKIICSSGYGIPVYGYEQLLRALLESDFAGEVAVVICLYNTYDNDYIGLIDGLLSQYGDGLVMKDLSAKEFTYLLSHCSMYVRCTDRDGDAVAIREANAFGLPTIASNVVSRPDFCRTYQYGDTGELSAVIREELSRPIKMKSSQEAAIIDLGRSSIEEILAAYGLAE